VLQCIYFMLFLLFFFSYCNCCLFGVIKMNIIYIIGERRWTSYTAVCTARVNCFACIVEDLRDVGSNSEFLRLVLHMDNMFKSRDQVQVMYPTDRSARKTKV